jgi:hypothetical protein
MLVKAIFAVIPLGAFLFRVSVVVINAALSAADEDEPLQ